MKHFKLHTICLPILLTLLVYSSLGLSNDALPRLFTTPDQRQHLDSVRYQHSSATARKIKKATQLIQPSTKAMVVNGFVKRDNGEHTIWISGKAYQIKPKQSSPVQLYQTKSDRVIIRYYQSPVQAPIELLPGQTYLPQQNRILENFALPVNHAPTAPSASPAHDNTEKSK